MKITDIATPAYVVDETLIERNLRILKEVIDETGCHILLAQKAFSMYSLYPLIGEYLHGTTASGLYEAKLGYEEMGKENHIFSPAYKDSDFAEIVSICDHIVFNSFSQLTRFGEQVVAAGKSIGLRINPEHSTQVGHEIYDPCAKGCRFGITAQHFDREALANVSGLHFHTLCEQDSDDLWTTILAVEERFGDVLYDMEWLNFGGGHHITKPGYNLALLKKCITYMKQKYNLSIYLEPGEAIAYEAGYLVTTVLDTTYNDGDIAILDTSASCHMPDVLEMPYRPPLQNSGEAGEKAHTYRLGGPTCLAGDVIGNYSFDAPLKPGDRLVFEDMAIYSMVKNNTFNGMALPDLVIQDRDGNCRLQKRFGYEDFKGRLS
ncbi:carboxynorspermidine decarboxylase [Kurthia sp. 3B1D]|uniref:Carboxynorspermidine decarboxylase n=1 Tax=Candidatus Kurthia intestinigallinarum TaxID=1562256 RepID=A0A433RX94_9BACL|nr:carboxynorspermidine decarboxylase [Kurthia sp. 3B1D]RUS57893.1 carboxynorspermidine decarboxylase [Kurthia sp. 3B1D]